MKFLQLIVENSYRNLIRTILTALGTMVLVGVVTLVWSVLEFFAECKLLNGTTISRLLFRNGVCRVKCHFLMPQD